MAIVAALLLIMAAVGWMIGGRGPAPIVARTPPAAPMAEARVPHETAETPASPRAIQPNSLAP